MPEFLKLLPPESARELFLSSIPERDPEIEEMDIHLACGWVTAEDVHAPGPLPEFRRSTVDGFALRARDTHGASESMPIYLDLVGEVRMGEPADIFLQPGQAAVIHTGGMLPEGADAVVMMEYVQTLGSSRKTENQAQIEIGRAVAEGENILQVGEDIEKGRIFLARGTRLKPASIGGALALGITRLRVAVKPKIGIISSGDEIVPPGRDTRPGQVRDVNSYTLGAFVGTAGGEAVFYGIVPDRLEDLKIAARKALSECSAVVITAGSSASARDMTSTAIDSLGKPGVLVHGINIRPGKPTILAVCDGKAVVGLPGNPVSALVIAGLFLTPLVEKLLGLKKILPPARMTARITLNVPSQAGREDWIPVRLIHSKARNIDANTPTWEAEPIFAKSNFILTFSEADGLVRIPPDVTGLSAGEIVDVFCL